MTILQAILLLTLAQDEWSQFRGPNGRGASADAVPVTWSKTENQVWKTELPGGGTSSPIVVGQKLYLTCYSGFNAPGQPGEMNQLKLKLVCLGRNDGKILWTKEIAPQLPEQAKIRDDHGYASSTLAADKERLYAFFGKSGVIAFDHDGKQLWKTDVGSKLHGWGSANSPVLYKNLVLINASVESDSLYALDAKTGKEVWKATGIKDSWNTPILVDAGGGKTEVVLAIMGKVLGFDPASGQQLWSCATDIPWYMVPSLLSQEGIVYCIGGRNGGGALAVKAGGKGEVTSSHRLWMVQKGSNVTSPILHGGHLYWMNESSGVAFCAEAKTGKIVYEERVDGAGQIYASPVIADGKIYYMARNGRTSVVAAKPQFEKLATNEFGDRSTFNASPAVAGGRMYVRSDHFLYCLGKK
jgi:outer membrane protein assembly factor BamB